MKKTKTKQEKINSHSMNLFTMICGYFLSILCLYSILQMIDCINLNVVQILSVVLPLGGYLFFKKELEWKAKIITISLYLVIILVTPFLYSKTYDLTIDGNTYHKTAIAFIKNGWNPLYDKARDYAKENDFLIEFEKKDKADLWIEHYPKATWIISGVIYQYTGNIESGKCITLIFEILLVIASFNFFIKIVDKKWTWILTILMALNPILLAQFFSYYVDGIMGILFFLELFLLIQVDPKEKIDKITWFNLAAIACVFVNLKFTGLLCSGVIAAVYYFNWLIKNRKEKDFLNIFKRLTIAFSIVYLISIVLVGSNSYIKNTIDHKNPLYPLAGKGKVDIITLMQPNSFKKKTKIEKFVISLFSKTENVTYTEKPTLKFPLRAYRSELDALGLPDARMAGFGPFFAAIILISLVLLGIGVWKIRKEGKEKLIFYSLPLLTILISMVLTGESWWARYIPEFYFIPIMAVLITVYTSKKKTSWIPAIVLSLLILVNSGCFLYVDYHRVKEFKTITQDIKEMKNTKDLEIQLGNEYVNGYLYTLKDNGVKYTVVEDIPEENKRFKYCWRVVVNNK